MKNDPIVKVFILLPIILVILLFCCCCILCIASSILLYLTPSKIYTYEFENNRIYYNDLIELVKENKLTHSYQCLASENAYDIPEDMEEYFYNEDCVYVYKSDDTNGYVVQIGEFVYTDFEKDLKLSPVCTTESYYSSYEKCEKANDTCIEKCVKMEANWYAGKRV